MKILSIDDSKMVHMVIARALKPYQVEHVTAMNGQDGVALASSEKPDLILMDVTMPVMTGMEALAALKSNPATASIPVVMLTAEGGTESITQATGLGAAKYLTKPFTEDVLTGCIRTFNELPAKVAVA